MAAAALMAIGVAASPTAAEADGYAKQRLAPSYSQADACDAHKFAGLYAGLHVGLASLRSSFEDVDGFAAGDRSVEDTNGGAAAAVQIGFNWARCNWLYGVEADYTWVNASSTSQQAGGGFSLKQAIDYATSLRARLGYAADAWLFYGTVGLAFGGLRTLYDNTAAAPPLGFESDEARLGFVIGGGVEYALSDHLHLTGTLLFYDFAAKESTIERQVAFGLLPSRPFRFEDDHSLLVLRLGVNYRFGDDERSSYYRVAK